MQHLPEAECAGFIEDLRNRETCQWCRHPREPIRPKLRLCNHCNYMRLKLRKLERRNEAFEKEHGGLLRDMLLDVRVQRHMIENAQAEGEIYRYFFDDDLLPLGLENEFPEHGKIQNRLDKLYEDRLDGFIEPAFFGTQDS